MPPDVMRPAVEMALMNSTKALFLLLASLLAWLFQTGHHEPGHGTGPAVAASTVVEAPAAAAARTPAARTPSPAVVSPVPSAGAPTLSAPAPGSSAATSAAASAAGSAATPAAPPAGSLPGATDARPGEAPIRDKNRRDDRQRPASKPRLAATIHGDQAWSVGHAIASRNGSRD